MTCALTARDFGYHFAPQSGAVQFNQTSLPGDRAHPIHVGDHAGMSTGGFFALTPTAKTEIINE